VVILTIAIHNAACNGQSKWQKQQEVITYLPTLLCHAFAGRRHGYHDAQRPLGHQNVETTMEYLHIAQLESQRIFSPLDTLLHNAVEVADVLRTLKLKVMDSIPGNFVRH
jgi:hypothetical protein